MNKLLTFQKITLFAVLFFVSTISQQLHAQDAVSIVKDMVAATKSYQTLSYEMDKSERFGSKYKPGNFRIKCREKPMAVYTYTVGEPSPGAELLWNTGSNDVLVRKANFPAMTLNLSMFNYLISKDSHHPLYHSSFRYFGGIVEHLIKKYEHRADELLGLESGVYHNGEKCYVLKMHTDDFKIINHTVDRKEMMNDFADRMFLSGYKIKDLNGIDYDDYLDPGDVIKITTAYARSMTIYVAAKNKLPVKLEIYDEEGLLEAFEYSNIKINPNFASDEFTRDFSEYNF